MKKIAIIVGTRPEAIKLAPVISAFRGDKDMQAVVISTGQHREMLQQVVDLFEIRLDYDLAVMQPAQTLASLTARLVNSISGLFAELKPDMTLAQGDTTTTFVAALASFYERIPFAHVEAGLRTNDIAAPFPEEANRRLTTPLTALHFPPTRESRQNLLNEGVPDHRITVTGNTVIDALQIEITRQETPAVRRDIDLAIAAEIGNDWKQIPFVLITGHRRENFGGGFEEICKAIRELAVRFPDYRFVYPVHLNPNVQRPVYDYLRELPNVNLLKPQDYRRFVALMHQCTLVLTDSGGVQEEAPSLGKPVLVMREATERPEGVAAGTVRLVGANAIRIVQEVSLLLTDPGAFASMAEAINPYGDGHASRRIVSRLREFFASGN